MEPPTKITSILHLQTAVYYALLTQSQGCLRTKTVHSEILWALNPSNNVCISIPTKLTSILILCLQISEAIRRYGISDSTTSLLVVEIGTTPSHRDKIKATVNGTVSPFSRLSEITDLATIKKVRHTGLRSAPTSHHQSSTTNSMASWRSNTSAIRPQPMPRLTRS